MNINITNVNSIKELSGKLETVFSGVRVQRNVLLVKEGNKTYRIKHKWDDMFSVELAIPVVYNALGAAFGVLLCFLTGFTGFIPMFIAIAVLLLIITGVYQSANKKDLEVFAAKLQGDDLPDTNESDADADSDDCPKDIDITEEKAEISAHNEKPEVRQRHGCVTAWLVLMVLANSAIALIYLLATDRIQENLKNEFPLMIELLGLMAFANVICAIMLFNWKKIGFWGFVLTSIVALIINLNAGLNPLQSLFGLLGVVILYWVLQFKRNNVTAWANLENLNGKTSPVKVSYPDVNWFIGTMKKLTDEQLIEAVKNRAGYHPNAVVAMKTVAMERGLIDKQWKILK